MNDEEITIIDGCRCVDIQLNTRRSFEALVLKRSAKSVSSPSCVSTDNRILLSAAVYLPSYRLFLQKVTKCKCKRSIFNDFYRFYAYFIAFVYIFLKNVTIWDVL